MKLTFETNMTIYAVMIVVGGIVGASVGEKRSRCVHGSAIGSLIAAALSVLLWEVYGKRNSVSN